MYLIFNTVAHMATFLALVAGWNHRILSLINVIVGGNHDSYRSLLDLDIELGDLDLDAGARSADQSGSCGFRGHSCPEVLVVSKVFRGVSSQFDSSEHC